jgi:DNA-binding response OmpR family regulator
VIAAEGLVFVVDDDAGTRESLKSLIRSVGLHVEVFASAQEFLRSPRPDVPGCLVLDVRLPGLSGLDLQRQMAAAERQIPIIFITGHGDIPMTVRAMKAGAVEFLTKPFRDQDLLDAIQQALERDRQARRAAGGGRSAAQPASVVDAAGAGSDGARGDRTTQQADSGRAGHERSLGQGPPAARDGEDASRVPGRPGPDGRPGRHLHPKVVVVFTKSRLESHRI